MRPVVQPRLGLSIQKDNWKLIRKRDKLIKLSYDIKWVEWDENNMSKKFHLKPKINYSLIMSPFNTHYTWMTTEVTEIIKETENIIIFKTKNSFYTLKRI